MNSSNFAFIWVVSILVFGAGLLAAPPNYDSSNFWSAFFGLTLIIGVVSFILAIFYWIKEKSSKKSNLSLKESNQKICKACNFENVPDSVYCQECGNKLHDISNNKLDFESKKSISEELSEVIFIPKKKSNTATLLLLTIILGFVGLIAIFILFNSESYQEQSPPAESEVTSQFPIHLLSLEDVETTIVENQLFFLGKLKNDSNEHAVDVVIRLDFSWDKAGVNKFDSRFIFIDYVAANGVRSLREPVDIYIPPNKEYWINYVVESAE